MDVLWCRLVGMTNKLQIVHVKSENNVLRHDRFSPLEIETFLKPNNFGQSSVAIFSWNILILRSGIPIKVINRKYRQHWIYRNKIYLIFFTAKVLTHYLHYFWIFVPRFFSKSGKRFLLIDSSGKLSLLQYNLKKGLTWNNPYAINVDIFLT